MVSRFEIEKLWREEKYKVMYFSQRHYNLIKELLKGDPSMEKLESYIQEAYSLMSTKGSKTNAYEHMWGYFKKCATAEEKKKFFTLLKHIEDEPVIKLYLYDLAKKYEVKYLLDSTILNGK
ncbi:MAG TPA: YbgA family protein [Candidatus Nosocomiicoccus stercorigallinarum]|nr:YbgA family protein [Candidatus Nosocomiicoccus stercorigallinarum]